MLHPLPLVAIALLIVNDHWLKSAWGGAITGKLSDFAGLAYFPFLLVALAEVIQSVLHRYRGPSQSTLVIASIATTVGFVLAKVTPFGNGAYELAVGLVSAPRAFATAVFTQNFTALPQGALVADPTDLIALPLILVAYLVGSRRCSRPSALQAARN